MPPTPSLATIEEPTTTQRKPPSIRELREDVAEVRRLCDRVEAAANRIGA